MWPAKFRYPSASTSASASNALRILYGMPTNEAFEASDRGEFALGGCVIGPESPDYECGDCGVSLPWVAPDDD